MTSTETYTATGTSSYEEKGTSVSLYVNYLAVGSPRTTNGTVNIYKRTNSNSNWLSTSYQTLNGDNSGDRFGTSVSLDNDHLAVGAPNVSVSGPFRGAVYVYTLNNDDPPQYDSAYQIIAQTPSPTANDSANSDFFGRSVSIHGTHLIVGAPGKNSNDGAVYVYEKSGGIWNIVAKLTPPSSSTTEGFGTSVSHSGNWVVVGAPNLTTNTGKIYIYDINDLGASPTTYTGEATNNYFGFSVSVGNNKVVAGAFGYSSFVGRVYTYKHSSGSWAGDASTLDGTTASEYGASVAIASDGPGLIVGAPNADAGSSTTSGVAYLYERSDDDTEWGSSTQTLTQSVKYTGDDFGESVTISGSSVAVGAPAVLADKGAVYVYQGIITTTTNTNTAQAFGDPHIVTLFGEKYDLPHVEDTFVLYANESKDMSIKGYTWYLPESMYNAKIQKLVHNGYRKRANRYLKLFKSSTYFKYLEFVCNNQSYVIDMNTLDLCVYNSENSDLQAGLPIIKDNRQTKFKSQNFMVTKIFKLNDDIKQRNITISNNDSTLKIELFFNKRKIITHNGFKLSFDDKLNIVRAYGSLIKPSVIYSNFGSKTIQSVSEKLYRDIPTRLSCFWLGGKQIKEEEIITVNSSTQRKLILA